MSKSILNGEFVEKDEDTANGDLTPQYLENLREENWTKIPVDSCR